jgi:adenine deaminase
MEMYDGYFKRAFHTQLSWSSSGYVECDISGDILNIAIVDRHHATRNCGIGFVRRFGLQREQLHAHELRKSEPCGHRDIS